MAARLTPIAPSHAYPGTHPKKSHVIHEPPLSLSTTERPLTMASLRRIERLQEHLTAADAVETVCGAGAGAGGAAAAALDGESAGLAADAAAFVTKWVDARPGIDPTHSLRGQTLLVTGGSRGIGLAIALAAAKEGANVAICAKTVEAHPTLPGTIFTAAKAVEDAGGRAIAIQCDIRYEEQVRRVPLLSAALLFVVCCLLFVVASSVLLTYVCVLYAGTPSLGLADRFCCCTGPSRSGQDGSRFWWH